MVNKKKESREIRFSMVKKRHRETFEKAAKEGRVDKKFISLCRHIASTENYFTSSCCSGRIILLRINGEERDKRNCHFHRKWHDAVTFDAVWSAINEKICGTLWFKLEPFILHIGCKDLEHAQTILKVMKLSGVKRGGIIVAKEGKFIVECMGTQEMAFIVKKDDKLLINKSYAEFALDEANIKLGRNEAMLKRLESEIRKRLK